MTQNPARVEQNAHVRGQSASIAKNAERAATDKSSDDDARRIPAQRRSQDRVEHVVECATRLIIAHDPQSVTTTMVAAAANVSVGSIYRYFQDKDALFAQILVHALTRLNARLEEKRDFDLATEDWRSAVTDGIDTVVEFVADDAAFRKLWFSTMLTPEMMAANRSHDLNLAKRLARHIQPLHDSECDREAIRVCEMFFGIIDTGVDLAFRSGNPDGDARMVAEMKVAAVRYMESYLE